MKHLLLLFLFLSLIASPALCQAAANGKQCLETDTVVYAAKPADFSLTCDAARKAIDFMKQNGFDTAQTIFITISDTLPNRHSPAVYGLYSSSKDTISLLSYASFSRITSGQKVFGVDPDEMIYQSFIAHEVAHAVARYNFTFTKPPQVAHEYIAYVVQFATMPKELRDRILQGFSYGPFEDHREINSIYFSLSPENFAIKSYLHFVRPENGSSFFATILNQDILDRCSVRYNC